MIEYPTIWFADSTDGISNFSNHCIFEGSATLMHSESTKYLQNEWKCVLGYPKMFVFRICSQRKKSRYSVDHDLFANSFVNCHCNNQPHVSGLSRKNELKYVLEVGRKKSCTIDHLWAIITL